jgi:enamine deaminase RidA (YjgF/YER057c/UK114 family)
MQNRQKVFSGTRWEEFVGYSRAIRIGTVIEVSGTIAVDESGSVVAKNDAYGQTIFILEKIRDALDEAGGTLEDVVRTRMYVTDIRNWELVGKAHGTFFKDIRPASTLIEVSSLIGPDYLVEIEATAVLERI